MQTLSSLLPSYRTGGQAFIFSELQLCHLTATTVLTPCFLKGCCECQGNTHCYCISPENGSSTKQDFIHFLSHCNPRAGTQLTLTKYLLNERINEASDVKEHCKCQVCHYYFIFSLFFKAILKTGFPATSWPPAVHTPRVRSGTNPAPAPRSNTAGLLAGDSENLEESPVISK